MSTGKKAKKMFAVLLVLAVAMTFTGCNKKGK